MSHLSPLALAASEIRHRRYSPKAHAFNYHLNYMWFDADQIQQLCAPACLWSDNGFNVLVLNATDFLSQYAGCSIRAKLADVLWQKLQCHLPADAQIRVLALPRCLGKRFNSVVFYYVFLHDTPQWIMSEITNTPWDERTVYVHDCRGKIRTRGDYQGVQFQFDKAFHVSPFMPMNLQYQWHFHWSQHTHYIQMQLFDNAHLVFDATMKFELKPITQTSQQNLYALQYVLQPFKMLGAIYIQALRLWLKRIPFFPHPHKTKDEKNHNEN